MPAPRPTRSHIARRFAGSVAVLLAAALLAGGQPARIPEPTRAGAVKLPDGTVVFYTKNPDEADPPIEGVFLSPQEYKTLLEQVEQLKRLKDAPRPLSPSECRVRGKIEPRGDRAVAALTLTYSFRTTAPKAVVALGGQKAFPLAARLNGDKMPALGAGDDGLTALIDAPGEHTLTLDVEAPVGPRGGKAEVGFEIGLPRAAITTLDLAAPDGVKRMTVGVRTAGDRFGEVRRTAEDAAVLAGYPLGPAELLEVAWQPPTAAPMAVEAVLSAEIDAAVRVDGGQVETTALVRLRGPAREWSLVLPPGADVVARRAASASPREPATEPSFAPAPALSRPTDPDSPIWTFRPPDGGGTDWDLTVTARQPRPGSDDPAHKGPYPVGPFAVPTAARQSGTVRVYAPPAVRLAFKHPSDVRRQDAPVPEEDLVAAFRFASVGAAPGQAPRPLLEIEAHPARTFTRVQPAYGLRRTPEAGWRLEAEVTVTPVRTEADEVVIDIPAGWQSLEAGPLELVEGVREVEDTGAARRYAIRLTAPQKSPFLLKLTATLPVEPPTVREATVPLPRFPGAVESAAKLTATVPEGLEIARAFATGPDGESQELKPANSAPRSSAAVTTVTGQFEKGVAQVRLGWQPYRPELAADVRAEVQLGDGQATIEQTVRFRAADGEVRPIRLRGPAGATGLRSVHGGPPVDPAGPGEWVLRPPADGSREFTLSVRYALPIPPRRPDQPGPTRLSVGLLWPEAATRVEATVSVWGGGSVRRVAGFDGPWRQLPPEPRPDRDSLPSLTLAGTGPPVLPLTLELAEPADGLIPPTEVERALVQVWLADDGVAAVRGRFQLRRWSAAGVDVELPAGVVPDVSVDGRHADPVPLPAAPGGPRLVRVPAPEPRAGRSVLLDVRYLLPAARPTPLGERTIVPPRFPGAAFRSPARWQVLVPPDAVPLYLGSDLRPDVRWGWRRGLPAPVAAASTEELERWVADGTDPDADENSNAADAPSGDALTARQPVLGPVTVYRFGRVKFAAACSLVVLALGLAVSQLRPRLIGPALAIGGTAVAVLAAVWPQPAAQVAAASIPGVFGLGAVLAGLAAVRWYYRRRVAYLPGFTRTGAAVPPESVPVVPRSSQAGSAVVALEGSSKQPAPSGS
jgi:hypothetical protein